MSQKPLHDKFDSVEYGIKYPLNNDHPIETAFSILITMSTSMFILPAFVLMGYLVKVRGAALNGDIKSPRFENYRELALIGSRSFVTYLPILFAVGFSLFLSLYYQFLLGFAGIPIAIWPIVSIKFAETEDYTQVYDGEILDIITSDTYIRALSIFTFILVVFITATIILGLFSVGLGLLFFLPLIIWFKAAFWGYVGRKIKKDSVTGD